MTYYTLGMIETCTDSIPAHDFSKGFMYFVHHVYTIVQKHLEQALLKENTISFSQFMILIGFMCKVDTPVSQASIASFSHLTEATVSRHISTLVSIGYLSRKEDKENRRKHRIMITKKGISVFKKAEQIIDKELELIFKNIQEPDRKNIMKNFSNILTQLLSKK